MTFVNTPSLPDILALGPEVMITRQGDDNWTKIATRTLSAMLCAEQEGITPQNVDAIRAKPTSPQIGKVLGATPGVGKGLGDVRQLGLRRDQEGRQLRRDLRPRPRQGLALQDRPRAGNGGTTTVLGTDLNDDVGDMDGIRREVGTVFQRVNLFPHRTVLDNRTLAPMPVGKIPQTAPEEFFTQARSERTRRFPSRILRH